MSTSDAAQPTGMTALYEKYRYSGSTRAGDLLFVSGQVGARDDGSPEPDFETQVQLAFDTLAATLKAEGASFDDIVDLTTYHTDPERQIETVIKVRERALEGRRLPNWTAVGVTWLAGFDFEIKVVARIPPAA